MTFSKKFHLAKRHWYGVTNSIRVLPDFIVIGAAKSGTTSLYHYLAQHPCIASSSYDELGYFDDNYHLGINWYKSLFPTKFTKNKIIKKYGKFLTYDVTPGYFQKPWCIKNMYETLPDVKLILVLRNPVDRTYSHYHSSTKRGIKTKIPFRDLLDRDLKTYEQIKNDDNEYFKNFVLNSYIGPSIYVRLVKEWLKYFRLEQLLIFSTEELAKNPREVFSRIFGFLNIKEEEINTESRHNVEVYDTSLDSDLRQRLIDFFRPHNEELFNTINQRFDWDK
jgi:hypothetical protein